MRRLTLALALAASFACAAHAQQNRPTVNVPTTIATGSTFQQILPQAQRWSVTVQNNNANGDNCWLFIGAGSATKGTSILLGPGGSYQRYQPTYTPSDVMQATCASSSDTLYVDYQ